MLTKADFRTNFLLLRLMSVLGILPIHVDLQTRELTLLTSTWRRGLASLTFLYFCLHTVYVDIGLVHTLLLFGKNAAGSVSAFELLLHIEVAIGGTFVCIWYVLFFGTRVDESVVVFNEALRTWGIETKGK